MYSSPAVGADGTVYVNSDDGNLFALNPADGSLKWVTCTTIFNSGGLLGEVVLRRLVRTEQFILELGITFLPLIQPTADTDGFFKRIESSGFPDLWLGRAELYISCPWKMTKRRI